MLTTQSAMGITVAALCAYGLIRARWLFETTRKGRKLAARFGESRGFTVLRFLLVAGVLFGVLLAADVIRPLNW
jgi:hypothetical protein